MINWKRCWGSLDQPSLYGTEDFGENNAALEEGTDPTGNRIGSIAGTAVMFAEVVYD